ncbi:ComF family protein [candidate division WOR-3 bacterium]|nr:ComF family protein [candidate division WOR-3 bacterium]
MEPDIKSRFLSAFFGLLMPSKCPICGKMLRFGEVCICDACLELCGTYKKCPFCSYPLPSEGFTHDCKLYGGLPFTGVFFIGEYEGTLKEAVKAMKFSNYSKLGIKLGLKLSEKIPFSGESNVLVPIPSSRNTRRQRGYNQAEIMAEAIAGRLGFCHLPEALIVKGKKKNQVGLSRGERETNMKGKMSSGRQFGLIGKKRAIIIDDVMTTGATLAEAHRVLKKSGAKEIYAAVAAIACS